MGHSFWGTPTYLSLLWDFEAKQKRLASTMEANLKSREQSIIKTATFDFENLLILRPFALTHSQVLSECQRVQVRSWQTS